MKLSIRSTPEEKVTRFFLVTVNDSVALKASCPEEGKAYESYILLFEPARRGIFSPSAISPDLGLCLSANQRLVEES